MRLAAFLQVMLMILFSAPERWSGFDLRHNWAIEPAALLQFFFRSVSEGLLLRGMIKNYRSILHANIGPCRFSVVGLWFDQKTSRSSS